MPPKADPKDEKTPAATKTKAASAAGKEGTKPDRGPLKWLPGWLMLIAGYLLTALAATLGSPFWFDMLNRFVNIRSAMKPPAPPRTGRPSPRP